MSMDFHPILKEVESKFIKVYDPDTFNIINMFNIPINASSEVFKGNIRWIDIVPNYSYDYSNCGNKDFISLFEGTPITEMRMVVQIGYSGPAVLLKGGDLIYYWEEFLHATIFGFPAVSEDGKYMMEIIKKPEVIYSNFKVG